MLNWWRGQPLDDCNRDSTHGQDAPETPAPVFAARAIKSAIFGTPARKDDDETLTATKGVIQFPSQPYEDSKLLSPSKPSGILLTPGTGTSRRKRVSFGAEMVNNNTKAATGRSGLPHDYPGKFPSPWVDKIGVESSSKRRSTLTRSLEEARGENKLEKIEILTANIPAKKTTSVSISGPSKDVSETKKESQRKFVKKTLQPPMLKEEQRVTERDIEAVTENEADMTMDLNEPRSQSGRFWKSEYKQYLEQARGEMKKLALYKQSAESYAKKRDDEALELGLRLEEEKQKVAEREGKLSSLAADITYKQLEGSKENFSPLLKELARQTTLAVQYKSQVQQFQSVLNEKYQRPSVQDTATKPSASARDDKLLFEMKQELKGAGIRLQKMSTMKDEVHSLRANLTAAEKMTKELYEDNLKLKEELKQAKLALEHSKGGNTGYITQASQRKRNSIDSPAETASETAFRHRKFSGEKTLGSSKTNSFDKAERPGQKLRSQLSKFANSRKSHSSPDLARLNNVSFEDLEVESMTPPNKRRSDFTLDGLEKSASEKPHSVKAPNSASMDLRKSRDYLKTGAKSENRHEGDGAEREMPLYTAQPALQEVSHNASSQRTMQPPSAAPALRTAANKDQKLLHDDVRSLQGTILRPNTVSKSTHMASMPPNRIELHSTSISDKLKGPRAMSDGIDNGTFTRESHEKRILPPEREAAAKARLIARKAEKMRLQSEGTGKENIRM